jgi:acyl-CoA synthetase (AMP-forming)/AMP-acid ligase II
VRRRLESCGRPVPGVEFRIVEGEVWIKGDQVGGGYVGTESQVDPDGWLHTGDQGFLDDQGYLFVLGRGDDVIIRGGENISPAEIEDALMRHPSVAAAAAVGLPDVEWGERVAAMVVLHAAHESLDVAALREWSREELGSIKAPELVVVAEDLPQTPTGKILRREVRNLLRQSTL